MSISTTPPPPAQKKEGMGCLACGCIAVVVIFLLGAALVAGLGYFGYTKIYALTSPTAVAVPAGNPSDDLYASAEHKIAAFNSDVKSHKPATLKLSADEINALIAHAPGIEQNKVRAYVTLNGSEGRLQASIPTDQTFFHFIHNRYFNADASFEVNFDVGTKSINFTFSAVQFGTHVLLNPNGESDSSSDAAFNQSFMRSFTPAVNQSFNDGIRKNPDGATLLDEAKTVEIKDSQLVIETQ